MEEGIMPSSPSRAMAARGKEKPKSDTFWKNRGMEFDRKSNGTIWDTFSSPKVIMNLT